MSEDLVILKNYNGEKIDVSFECDAENQPLVDFFNNKAAELVKNKISTVKTINYDNKLVGYYAISMSSIEAGDLFDEKRSATYPHPAIIIGRLLI